jgi:hypothetical protein
MKIQATSISRRDALRRFTFLPASLMLGKLAPAIGNGAAPVPLLPVRDFASLKANIMAFSLRAMPKGPSSMAVLGELERIREIYDNGYLDTQRADGMFLADDYPLSVGSDEPKLLERLLINQRVFISHSIYLGHVPRYRYGYLSDLLANPERNVVRFLESMNWKHTWTMGNVDMAVAYALLSQWRTFGDERAKRALKVWIKWHSENADAEIGFWDPAKTRNLHSVMAGGAHQLGIHFMLGLEIPYPDRMVDTALSLQNNIGMFGWRMIPRTIRAISTGSLP